MRWRKIKAQLWSLRAETVAAVASAVGTIASALLAAYAFTFLSHQEDIAKQQLQATYLSTLYSKQVDSFATFAAALSDFDHEIADFHWNPNEPHLSFDELKKKIVDNDEKYQRSYVSLEQKNQELQLITPPSIENTILLPKQVMNRALSVIRKLKSANPVSVTELNCKVTKYLTQVDHWRKRTFECIRAILVKGGPVTKDELADQPLCEDTVIERSQRNAIDLQCENLDAIH